MLFKQTFPKYSSIDQLRAAPVLYQLGHFVAVRRGVANLKHCVFKSWEDAKEHVQDPNAVYSSFDNIHEAETFAFKREISLVGDCSGLSAFENLPQDVKNVIYSFTCGIEITDQKNEIGNILFLSQSLHQSCHIFAKTTMFDFNSALLSEDYRPIIWFANNGTKLSSFKVIRNKVTPPASVEESLLFFLFTTFNTKYLQNLYLDFGMPKYYIMHEEDTPFMLRSTNDAIVSGIPFEALHLVNKKMLYDRIVHTLWTQTPPIQNMKLITHYSPRPILSPISKVLVDLELELFDISSNKVDEIIDDLTVLINEMPSLEKLKITVDDADSRNLSIMSKTLNELISNINLNLCLCPALTKISIKTIITQFDPTILESCSNTLECMTIDLWSCYGNPQEYEVDSFKQRLLTLGTCINRMPTLKKVSILSLNKGLSRFDVSDIWDATIINPSLIDITITLNNKSYIKEMHCPLLTSLGIDLSSITSPGLSSCLPGLVELTVFCQMLVDAEVQDEVEVELEQQLQDLSQVIASMPKLKVLTFKFDVRNVVMEELTSNSLEVIDIIDSCRFFYVQKCNCPSLKKFRCRYYVDKDSTAYINGIRLRLTESSLERITRKGCQTIVRSANRGFLGTESNVPKSCKVELTRGF